MGFHGQFSKGGLANEENPLVYADSQTGEYFHFIGNDEPAIGHLDGLLATGNKLYAADISSQGGFGSSAQNSGVIYLIRYTGDPPTAVVELAASPRPNRNAGGGAAGFGALCFPRRLRFPR